MPDCRTVAILVFDDIEVLDFAGPYEVFNVTAELQDPTPFLVYTVSETNAPIRTRGNLVVHPNYSIHNVPKIDILIVPGGSGTRALLKKPHLIEWIRVQYSQVEILASVCSGSLVLAKAGLLDGLEVTTHHTVVKEFQALLPSSSKIVSKRYVDHGKILTSGGISAGIDMCLYLVRKLLGNDALDSTTKEMEYTWTPDVSSPW